MGGDQLSVADDPDHRACGSDVDLSPDVTPRSE